MTRVCFYARFSRSRNVASSIEYQVDFAERWCAHNGMSLVDIVVEIGIGPEAFKRPQFERLMAQALDRAPQFDVLLVHSPRRSSRYPKRLAFLIKRLERLSVRIETITGKIPANLA